MSDKPRCTFCGQYNALRDRNATLEAQVEQAREALEDADNSLREWWEDDDPECITSRVIPAVSKALQALREGGENG